jgi:hypothetical protein
MKDKKLRGYTPPWRIEELMLWLKKRKTASWQVFVRETGGTLDQYYHVRSKIGLSKRNPALSIAMKEAARKRAEQKLLDLKKLEETLHVTPPEIPAETPADTPVEAPVETVSQPEVSLEQTFTAPPDVSEIQQEMCRKTLVEIQEDNEQFLAGKEDPAPKEEEVVVEGNTPDFIWYEMNLLQRRLQSVAAGLNNVMSICQSRDREKKKMMHSLINENTTLRIENDSLKQQVMELTEMINGTSV